jgi:hypothetical protein
VNLHRAVAPLVGVINPNLLVTVMQSIGYATAADGTQTPAYQSYANVRAQVQALSYTDILKMDGLAIQGNRRAIYLSGNWQGLNRAAGKGGDLIIIPCGPAAGTWLVAQVLEAWATWTKVEVTQQMNAD